MHDNYGKSLHKRWIIHKIPQQKLSLLNIFFIFLQSLYTSPPNIGTSIYNDSFQASLHQSLNFWNLKLSETSETINSMHAGAL